MSKYTIPAPVILPAQHGWFRLWLDTDSGELFDPDPLIAWEVVAVPRSGPEDDGLCYEFIVYPITTEGRVEESTIDTYLLRPNGTVELPTVRTWNDLKSANTPDQCAWRLSLKSPRLKNA